MTRLPDSALDRLRAGATHPSPLDSRYTLLEVLGEGGMGTVYRGMDELLEREVAIKVVRVPTGREAGALVDRLRAESRVLARLEHPGIVPVHDVGVLADGRVYYVMKLVRGATFTAAAPGLELDRRLAIVERVAEATAFAHQHGVIHRDLKPDNIMVGEFGEVLVMDWGVAKVLGGRDVVPVPGATVALGATDPGTVLGTPGYMSPEQALAGPVDPRADIYSLGAVLAFAATGRQPGAAVTAGQLLTGESNGVRPQLRAIAVRCLAAAPANRYPSAAEVAEEVRRFRSGGKVAAHREGIVERVGRWLRTYRTPVLLVVAYLLMRVVVAFVGR